MKKTMKNIITVALLVSMVLTLASCGSETASSEASAVSTDDKGNLVGADGKMLTPDEVKALAENGDLSIPTKDGKTSELVVSTDKGSTETTEAVTETPVTTEKSNSPEKDDNRSTTPQKKEQPPTDPSKPKEIVTTEKKQTEKTTEAPKKTEDPKTPETPKTEATKTTEAPKTSKTTETPKTPDVKQPEVKTTEAPKECSHKWVWATKTKTIHHDAVTHQEPVYDYNDGHYEYVEHKWIQCNTCMKLLSTMAEYEDHPCYPGCTWSSTTTYDEKYYPPKIIDYRTVVDQKAYDEYVEEKDYQYCSICGEKK